MLSELPKCYRSYQNVSGVTKNVSGVTKNVSGVIKNLAIEPKILAARENLP